MFMRTGGRNSYRDHRGLFMLPLLFGQIDKKRSSRLNSSKVGAIYEKFIIARVGIQTREGAHLKCAKER